LSLPKNRPRVRVQQNSFKIRSKLLSNQEGTSGNHILIISISLLSIWTSFYIIYRSQGSTVLVLTKKFKLYDVELDRSAYYLHF
jgi:hypothetical protein